MESVTFTVYCVLTSVSPGLPTRDGTDADADSAYETFKKLGYEVQVQRDLTVKEMKTSLKKGNGN